MKNDRKLKFLITGAHGDIAISIKKILVNHFPFGEIWGSDCLQKGIGAIKFDNFVVLPYVSSPNYLSELKRVADLHSIDVIIPTSEPEIKFLNLAKEHPVKSKVLIINSEITSLCFDKLATANFLKINGLPSIETSLSSEDLPCDYPVIFKPRFGAGSSGIKILKNKNDLAGIENLRSSDFIFQKYVGDESEEYTSCLYCSELGGVVKVISLRRILKYGVTVFAEPVVMPEIEKKLILLGEKLKLIGSINAQFRLVDGTPFVFEINPRFSSTVYFRHQLGFKDLVWSINAFLNLVPIPNEPIKNLKFYRFFDDITVSE